MMSILLYAAAALLKLVYIPFRFLKVKRRVTFLSRQSDTPSRDIELAADAIGKSCSDAEIFVLCKTIGSGVRAKLSYCCHMFRQMYLLATSSVVILDGYCIVASILPHKDETGVIQMWHACAAVKKFGWQTVGKLKDRDFRTASVMRMHDRYDYVMAPSHVTAAHFCEAFRCTPGRIRYIGPPHLSELMDTDSAVISEMNADYPALSEKKNILYVPTFRRGEAIPVRRLYEAVDPDQYNLVVRLHPLSPTDDLPSDVIADSKYSTYDWMKRCDVVISDYSSLIVEAAIMGKRLFIYAYDYEQYEKSTGFNIALYEESIAKYVFRDERKLMAAVGDDYDFRSLARFREKYVEVDVRGAAEEFADFTASILRQNVV